MKQKSSISLTVLVMMLLAAGCIGPIKDISYHPPSMITIRDSQKTICFTLYAGDKTVKPKKGNHYYWYGTNRIHNTVGDYSGRLLNGSFMTFDEAGGLIEKGSFDKGLKTGRWVTWSPTGEVLDCLKYRKGFAQDTARKSLIKKLFPGKKDTTGVKPPKEKKEKPNKKEKREKEKVEKQK